MKKKSGFSLIEIILGLAIVAAMSVVAFVTYSYISEKMIVKKESDFPMMLLLQQERYLIIQL